MGSIFGNPVVKARSTRQLNYIKGKKTDRKVTKHEELMQIQLCEWIRTVLPDVHFRSDTGSGAFNSKYAKDTHNKQQSSDGLPDLTIFAARRGYHGLLLELKADGVKLKKQRNGTKIIVRKDSRGRIVEHDYKIRMKGDWTNLHIEKQAKRIAELKEAGYCAGFVVGLDHAKKAIAWYFDFKIPTNKALF